MDERTNRREYLTNNDQEGIFHPSSHDEEQDEVVQETKHTHSPDKEVIEKDRYYTSSIAPARRMDQTVYEEDTFISNRLVQFVYYVGGILSLLVALRFILALFGARNSGFASFIFQLTEPLVTPFRGVFGVNAGLGAARFEVESLISIVVIGVLTFIIAGFIQLLTRDNTT